ncbi:hypothetical protein [Marivita hallyeonensis]|uniref:NADH dehydrogenase subunit C n=1 Tax=Marivita hallyeonensis TaxID=996342 RepID=A0A1M5RIY8_9RHOB|nr:hypothetical protein [Marivita hallyeonensis]SHH26214.1 hypothetical protein SAMN05443551_1779 [Marivita hallyeonensis]
MEFVIWLAITAATVIPLMKLLPHFGYDAKWAFVAVIPLGAIVLLWVMATKLNEMEKR